MVKRFTLHFFYSSVILILSSCAQVVPPTGGPKDTQPPTVLNISPEHQSINFTAKEVSIEFDEFLSLRKLKDNLLISPPLKYDLDVSIKGKKLLFSIKDTLKENTTYVINFGNAITDLSENNPLRNFQYVFATGNSIDTLIQNGKVLDAFSLEVQEELLVMLYPETVDDSAFQTQLPSYVSRTDKEGAFHITNVKEGKYRLYALKDRNNNYLFDRSNEAIAFLDTSIIISNNTLPITLKTFEEPEKKQFIDKKEEKTTTLFLEFKQKVDSLNYAVLDTNMQPLLVEVNSDTVRFWWPELDKKEIDLAIRTQNFSDTLEIEIDSLPRKDKLKLASSYSGAQNYFQPIPLIFNRPIQELHAEKFLVQSQSGRVIPFTLKKDSSNSSKIILDFIAQEDSIYVMQLFPKSVVDIYGQTVDSSFHQLTFNTAEDFGELNIILENTGTSDKIVQLINDKGTVMRSAITKNNSVNFKHLMPLSYRVKLIEDLNSNGKWDSGIYQELKQPERTFLFEEKVEIRKNWEKEVRWAIK